MKKYAVILIFMVCSALAQTGPNLGFRKLATGEIELSWKVEKVYPAGDDLFPRFSIEVGSEIGIWQPTGQIVLGETFTNGNAVFIWSANSNQPMGFFRIERRLDFRGRHFIDRVFTNAAFTSADFSGADLLRANLTDASLRNAVLGGADFRDATLERVDARGANLVRARLAGAKCTLADFGGADLRFAEFTDADLTVTSFDNADLRGAILEGATNFFARFQGSTIDSLTVMDERMRSIWQIVNNQGAGKNFSGMTLNLTDLSNGNLTNASLVNTDLSGAILAEADLSGANLTGAILRFLDLRGTKMTGQTTIAAKWRTIWDVINNPKTNRVHLSADFTVALFIDTVFDHADLRGARFTSSTIGNVNFNSANLQTANLSQCDIFDSDFRNANLTSANLVGASFDGADLTGATLTGANLSGVTFVNTIMPDGSRSN